MKKIFDFAKTYTGFIVDNDRNYPCSLSFEEYEIVLTIISEDQLRPKDFREKVDFCGFVTTESGVKSFKAFRAIQTFTSYNWSIYSKQQFTASALIVTHEKNDIHATKFKQANIMYDNLSEIGIFLNASTLDEKIFSIDQKYKELTLLKEGSVNVTLENPYTWSFGPEKKSKLSISIEPFISYESNEELEEKDLVNHAIQIGWFFQLVFGLRQSVTWLLFFDSLTSDLPENVPSSPYYYFHKEMIRSTQQYRHPGINQFFRIEDLFLELPLAFTNWHNFNDEQKFIYRFFFNEINGRELILDDRFKNLCSIIQGLDVFPIAVQKVNVRGDMNKKLHRTLDQDLGQLIFNALGKDFTIKLFSLIGDQRDHFQHLNKPLKFDFNENRYDIIAVNQLLTTLIKYHLWKALELPIDKIITLIKGELAWFINDLLNLKQRLDFPTNTVKEDAV